MDDTQQGLANVHPRSEFTAAGPHPGGGEDKTQGPQGCLGFPDPKKAGETFQKKKRKHPILLVRRQQLFKETLKGEEGEYYWVTLN